MKTWRTSWMHVGCWAVFLVLQAGAQQSKESPAAGEKFTVKNEANTVVVPVLVRDAQGREVGNLKQEDFQVFDNDRAQVISGFTIEKHVRVDLEPKAADHSAEETPAASATAQSPAPARFLALMFDDLHLSAEDLARVQKAATTILGTVASSEMAAIVSTSGRISSGLILDHAVLREMIAKLSPQGLYRAAGAECPDIDYYNGDLIVNKHNISALESAIEQVLSCDPNMNSRDVAQRIAESAAMRAVTLGEQDARVTLSSIREYVRGMAALPGERTLILVSPGFLTITAAARSAESEVMDLAAQANITISSLDARGLYITELDASAHGAGSAEAMERKQEDHRNSMGFNENVMAELADATGGEYFHNRNDLQAGLSQLAAGPEYLYLLYVTPKHVKQDGTYHRLKVTTDVPGAKVTARHGYFAAKAAKSQK